MAEPIAFPEANLVLGPPKGVSEDECGRLPVFRHEGRLVSCWRPTLTEMTEIITTGVVWLSVWGRETQPPVLVSGNRADVFPGGSG